MTDSPGLIYERLAAILADVPAIPKAQKNQQQGYAFRGIDDMYDALHGLFVTHQVVILPEVLDAEYVQQPMGRNNTLATDARLRIRYTFATTDGSSASMVVQGESRDYADKATNQAMSGALKYGLLQMFLIPLHGSVESDHASPEVVVDTPETIAAKKVLVDVIGTADGAAQFWHNHRDLAPETILSLARQAVAEEGES